MKFRKSNSEIVEPDLTPMIDMTFQLIAFFMFAINFAEVDRVEQIMLPKSNLARPPQSIPDHQIILNLDQDGSVFHEGQRVEKVEMISPLLRREVASAARQDIKASNIAVIIRAHEDTETGFLQRLMRICQQNELEKFSLRVMEDR